MNDGLPAIDYDVDEDRRDRAWRRRMTYAERLIYGTLPSPCTDDETIMSYEPSALGDHARRLLRGIDRKPPADAAEALARAAGQLIGLARFAWWPWQMTGDLEMSADEKALDILSDVGWNDEWLGWPTRGRRRLFAEARAAVDQLVRYAENLDGRDRPRTKDVEQTAYGAIEWAQNLAMLAIEMNPLIATRESW